MDIRIVTDGFSRNTEVHVNGKKLAITDFHLTIKAPGKVKLYYREVDRKTGEVKPTSLFGANIGEISKKVDKPHFIGEE